MFRQANRTHKRGLFHIYKTHPSVTGPVALSGGRRYVGQVHIIKTLTQELQSVLFIYFCYCSYTLNWSRTMTRGNSVLHSACSVSKVCVWESHHRFVDDLYTDNTRVDLLFSYIPCNNARCVHKNSFHDSFTQPFRPSRL